MSSHILSVALFIVSIILLLLSGAVVVRNLSRIMHFFHLTEYFASFVLMAISTTIPELFVGISSALEGNPSLSLGNVVGSIIINLSLVAGIIIVLARKIKIKSTEIEKGSLSMIFIVMLPIVLFLIGQQISRIDGAILIFFFIGYYGRMIFKKENGRIVEQMKLSLGTVLLDLFLFVLAVFILYYSSKYTVHYGTELASVLKVHPIFIGLFFVAIGTSLPELVFGIHSVLAKHPRFVLGDLIGASIVNSTLVLGVTAVISPIIVNMYFYLIPAFTMLVVCFIFMSFLESGREMSLTEGVSLIMLYVLFLLVELALKGIIPVAGNNI